MTGYERNNLGVVIKTGWQEGGRGRERFRSGGEERPLWVQIPETSRFSNLSRHQNRMAGWLPHWHAPHPQHFWIRKPLQIPGISTLYPNIDLLHHLRHSPFQAWKCSLVGSWEIMKNFNVELQDLSVKRRYSLETSGQNFHFDIIW